MKPRALAMVNVILLLVALSVPVHGAEEPSDQAIVAFVLKHSPRIRGPGRGHRGLAAPPRSAGEGGADPEGPGGREQEVRAQATSLLQELRSLQAQVKLGEELMKEMEGQLQWMKRRVQEGVEYQKEANRFLLDLYGKKVEVEQRRAQIGPLIEKLVGLVEPTKQPKLGGCLRSDEALSAMWTGTGVYRPAVGKGLHDGLCPGPAAAPPSPEPLVKQAV